MERPDPLKIFLGSLRADISKPKLAALLERHWLTCSDIILPQCPAHKLAVAFVIFDSASDAQDAIASLNGLADPEVTPNAIKAQRGAIMGVFISC